MDLDVNKKFRKINKTEENNITKLALKNNKKIVFNYNQV